MNKVILIGNLTKDAELKFVNGNAITKFTIAVSRGYKNDDKTDFINCVAFGKIAENIAQYTTKGSKVAVDGSIRINSYTDKENNKRTSMEVYVNNIEFLSKGTRQSAPNSTDFLNENTNVEDNDDMFLEPLDYGDLPFN